MYTKFFITCPVVRYLNTGIDFPKVYNPDIEHSLELYTGEEISIESYFEPLTSRGRWNQHLHLK